MIVDHGCCTNVGSTLFVEKLNLPILRHPNLYHLLWLAYMGDLKVTKRVIVLFAIRVYEDEILCDVMAMHACHIILGRPG